MVLGTWGVTNLAHSGKILMFSILIMLLSVGFASALEVVSNTPNSTILQDSYMIGPTDTPSQIYYQKFKTDNTTLQGYKVQLYLPYNTTSYWLPSIWDRYIRIGIAKSSLGVLKYTPAQWYALPTLPAGFEGYSDIWKIRYYGSYVNFTFSNGNNYLEPNTEYYLAWYIWGDEYSGTPFTMQMITGGQTLGTTGSVNFTEWSIHRGNVTSAVWTDPYANTTGGVGARNLSYVLW